MGITSGNEQKFINCINMHDEETYVESKEQHDEFGDIVFYYKKYHIEKLKYIILIEKRSGQ